MLKIMVLLLIAAFAGLFFINGPNGEKVLSLDDFKLELPQANTNGAPAAPEQVYKWQDENGVWQFSNQPRDVPGWRASSVQVRALPTFSPLESRET